MAANHIFGLGNVVATTPSAIATLAVSATLLHAQQPSTAHLNADAQNLFKIISSDNLKIQIFCKIADLGNQLDQADQVHDIKKVEEVSRNLDEWQGKLPELTALVGGLTDLDPNSEDAQVIGSIILKLDEFCD